MMALKCIEHSTNKSTTQQLLIVLAIVRFLGQEEKEKPLLSMKKEGQTNRRKRISFCFTFKMSIVWHGPANKMGTMIR